MRDRSPTASIDTWRALTVRGCSWSPSTARTPSQADSRLGASPASSAGGLPTPTTSVTSTSTTGAGRWPPSPIWPLEVGGPSPPSQVLRTCPPAMTACSDGDRPWRPPSWPPKTTSPPPEPPRARGGAAPLQVRAAAGRRVPEDVAVVGFNDAPLAETTYPPLSSVRQPVEEMGREMVQLLLELIRTPHGARRRAALSTQLQVRRSSATPGQEGPGVTEGYRIEAIHTDIDRHLTRAPRGGRALLPR